MDRSTSDAGTEPTLAPGEARGSRAIQGDDVNAFLREADQHLGRAEALLRDLAADKSAPVRRMRAAMYVKAMRRLRHLIEMHRTLPWNRPTPPVPPIDARPPPRRRWLPTIHGRASPTGTSLSGHDP